MLLTVCWLPVAAAAAADVTAAATAAAGAVTTGAGDAVVVVAAGLLSTVRTMYLSLRCEVTSFARPGWCPGQSPWDSCWVQTSFEIIAGCLGWQLLV